MCSLCECSKTFKSVVQRMRVDFSSEKRVTTTRFRLSNEWRLKVDNWFFVYIAMFSAQKEKKIDSLGFWCNIWCKYKWNAIKWCKAGLLRLTTLQHNRLQRLNCRQSQCNKWSFMQFQSVQLKRANQVAVCKTCRQSFQIKK